MFRNILVCVDGSAQADQALTEAIDIALSNRARLSILTAVCRPPSWACTPLAIPAIGPLTADLEREAQNAMRDAVDRVPESVPVTKILSHKPIREALMSRLRDCDHDLLVVGSRGRSPLTSSLMGSFSQYALHHCPVPVLVVHSDPQAALDTVALGLLDDQAHDRVTASPPADGRDTKTAEPIAAVGGLTRHR